MTSAQVQKKLRISAFVLRKLRENGEIIATPINTNHYDYDENSVKNFYQRLYHRAKVEEKRKTDPTYKCGIPGRKRFIENIGRIGTNAMTVIAKDIGDLSVAKKKHTPTFNHISEKQGTFSEKKFLKIYEGYDFLRNLGIVSNYLNVRYGVNMNTLQTLLFLYPLQYFTAEDYKEFPHKGKYRAAFTMEGKPNELIEIAVHSTNRLNHIYTLNKKSKRIVVEFYKLVAGVKQIPKDANKRLKTKVNYNKVDPISDLAFYLAGKEVDA